MRATVRILLTAVCFTCSGAIALGQDGGRNVVDERVVSAVQQTSSIDGVWTFAGELSLKSCAEPAPLQTLSDTFQIDRNKNALYATASSDSLEFLGELQGGDFIIAVSPRSAELNESCTQVTALTMTGNWREGFASFSIVNNFIGSCPGISDCKFVYEGAFTKTGAKTRHYNNNKKFKSIMIRRGRGSS